MVLKKADKKVLVTGVFDILHIEHIRFLEVAKKQGGKLLVGVETDARVKQIKGPNRPINNQEVRLEQVRAIKFVDEAFLLPEKFNEYKDWWELMKTINPEMYAVSAHSAHLATKKEICQKLGIRLAIVRPHNPDISTTILLEKMKTRE